MRAETSTMEEADTVPQVSPPNLVDLIVEPHVRDEDGHLDNVVHPATGLLEDGLDVLQDVSVWRFMSPSPTTFPSASIETCPDTCRLPAWPRPAEKAPPRMGAGNVGLVITRLGITTSLSRFPRNHVSIALRSSPDINCAGQEVF